MPTLMLSVSGARGIVGDGLDEAVAFRLALAFGEAVGPGRIVIGRDSRPSGPALTRAVVAALARCACEVEDLGIVSTPTVEVAVTTTGAMGGVIVTASHNPVEWNALKFLGPDGTFLGPVDMEPMLARFRSLSELEVPREAAVGADLPAATPAGEAAIADHVARILATVDRDAIRAGRPRVVVDAVHGAGSTLLEPLLEGLGATTEWIDRAPDGNLPPHPEPRAERLEPLWARVREWGADVGFAVDPDADRCALVLPERVLGEEWTLPLAALARFQASGPGPMVVNLSTSSWMDHLAVRFGVPLLRTPVGEAHVVAGMRKAGAAIGGEGNGGVIDPQVHMGRDSGVAVALLLQLEATGGLAAAVGEFPQRAMVKRKLALAREDLPVFFERLTRELGEPSDRIDGLRWAWSADWIHVRPSGTEPVVRLIAEGPDEESARRLIEQAETVAPEER